MALPPPVADGTVLITGASSGIGREFARQLAARGYGVTLLARREERLREVARELADAFPIRAEAVACDLLDTGARDALPERLEALGLRVDILVSNAGFATGGPFHESPPEHEVQQVRLLCEAAVALTSMFLPPMVCRRSGCIVHVASTAGFQPLPNSAGYSAAKAHVLHFSEAVHAEVRRHGVTVSALCPGPVRTELFDKNDHPVERLPGLAWIDADQCVREGIAGAERGARVIVPGLRVRAGLPFLRHMPRFVQLPLTERLFR
jgi:uncharacterized protein